MSLSEHIAEEAKRVNRYPSEPQKRAGNYQKGHVKIHGLDISIENPHGSFREGKDADGKPWRARLPAHYGYVRKTEGADGDHVDVFVGRHPKSPLVYVVDQLDHRTGRFDEHKAFLGFSSPKQVKSTYFAAFSDGKGKDRLGHLEEMTVAQFKHWLRNGNTKHPVKQRAEGGRIGMADGGTPVTDPGILSQLNQPQPVTDPELLRQLDAGQAPDMGTLAAAAHGAASGATFGFSDELRGLYGAGKTVPDFLPGARMIEGAGRLASNYLFGNDPNALARYDAARDAERRAQQTAQAEHPLAYGAGEFAGAVPAMAMMPEAGAVESLAPNAGRLARYGASTIDAMTQGMGYGALSGAGEGTDAESRLKNAAVGTLEGAAAGAAAPVVGEGLGALGDRLAGRAVSKPIGVVKQPDTSAFFDAADNHYANMRGFGVEIDPKAVNRVADNITNELLAEGYRPRNAPKVFDAIEELRNPQGKNHEISDIDSVRKVLGKARLDPSERDAARRTIGHIDDYIANLGNNLQDVVVNPQFAGRVASEAQAARANFAVGKRSEDIDEALDQAERQAARAGSGGNINNAIRQRLSALRNNKRKMAGWSDAEKKELDAVINGSTAANAARRMGKFAPDGIVSTALSMGLGRLVAPGIGDVVLPVGGMVGKMVGDRLTQRGAERLSNVVKARSALGRENSIASAAESALAPKALAPPTERSQALQTLARAGLLVPVNRLSQLQGPMSAGADQEQPQPNGVGH